jgi:hypothetical protein
MTLPSMIASIDKHHRSLSSRWRMTNGAALLLSLFLLLLVFLAHGPALDNGFIAHDDPHHVTENPQVLQGLDAESIAWAFGSVAQGNWHPLTWLSHMLVAVLHTQPPGARGRSALHFESCRGTKCISPGGRCLAPRPLPPPSP